MDMDLLKLNATITTLDKTTLPQASDILNSALKNAAALLDGSVNNAAVLLAQLLQGAEAERTEAMNGINDALAPLIVEWKRTNDALERFAAIAERIDLKP